MDNKFTLFTLFILFINVSIISTLDTTTINDTTLSSDLSIDDKNINNGSIVSNQLINNVLSDNKTENNASKVNNTNSIGSGVQKLLTQESKSVDSNNGTNVIAVPAHPSVKSENSSESKTSSESSLDTNEWSYRKKVADVLRYDLVKDKLYSVETKFLDLIDGNLFLSIAIPALVGIGLGIFAVIIFYFIKHCVFRGVCFRILCCCCRRRRNNRLKYAKSKHLFGDDRNYLLVNNNESDPEIET